MIMLAWVLLVSAIIARLVYRYINSIHLFAFIEGQAVEELLFFHTSATVPIAYLLKTGFPEVEDNTIFYRITIDVNGVTERIVYMTKSGDKVSLFFDGMYKTSSTSWLLFLQAVQASPDSNAYWAFLFENEVLEKDATVAVSIVLGCLRPNVAVMSGLNKLWYIASRTQIE